MRVCGLTIYPFAALKMKVSLEGPEIYQPALMVFDYYIHGQKAGVAPTAVYSWIGTLQKKNLECQGIGGYFPISVKKFSLINGYLIKTIHTYCQIVDSST